MEMIMLPYKMNGGDENWNFLKARNSKRIN